MAPAVMYTVPRKIVPPPPSAGAWNVGPCERRVDGGRVTEYVLANDWLSGTKKGERNSTLNPLVVTPDQPPKLPMYMSRDHLHDRNREFVGEFDPARPGQQTYVRVTRRRAPPEIEAQLARERLERVALDEQMAELEVAERNELLELRSMGVRTAIEANKEANWRIQTGQWRPGQKQPEDPRFERADQLHKKLGVDKVRAAHPMAHHAPRTGTRHTPHGMHSLLCGRVLHALRPLFTTVLHSPTHCTPPVLPPTA